MIFHDFPNRDASQVLSVFITEINPTTAVSTRSTQVGKHIPCENSDKYSSSWGEKPPSGPMIHDMFFWLSRFEKTASFAFKLP